MPKSSIEPEYSQAHDPLEGFEIVRDWLNLSSGRCNIQVAKDLKGLVRDLHIVTDRIASQTDFPRIDVRGIDQKLGVIEDRFNGLIHNLGSTVGLSQVELNAVLLKYEKINSEDLIPQFLSIKKMIEEMDVLKPENHHVKSSGKGKINYSEVFKNCLQAYLQYTEFVVLLPEETTDYFRRQGENPLTPGENFVLGIGLGCIRTLRESMKGIKIKSSSNLDKLDELTESLQKKLVEAQKDKAKA